MRQSTTVLPAWGGFLTAAFVIACGQAPVAPPPGAEALVNVQYG